MARTPSTPEPTPRLPTVIAAAGFLLAEIAVLPGAASPFRLPKEAVALTAVCLAVAVAVATAARRRSVVLPSGRLTWVLVALPVLQLASAAWAASPLRALESALLSGLWVVAILWFATLDDGRRRLIGGAAVLGVAVSAVVMLLQLVGVPVFNFAAPFASRRLSLTGLTGNPADLAMAAALLLPLLLVWSEAPRRRWLPGVLIVLFSLAILISQTLAGIASLAAVLLVWLIRRRSRTLWVSVALIGSLVLALGLAAGLGDRLQRDAERALSGNWYHLFSARGDGWAAAGEMIRNRPMTGTGAANFSHLYYPSRLAWLERGGGTGGRSEAASHFEWAHCDPLQLLAELGLAGVLWMAALAWALIGCRSRAGPLLPLAAAAAAPFLLLHYPTHIAIGLIPITLVLGEIVNRAQPLHTLGWHRARLPVVAALVLLLVAGAWWQLRRVAVDVWMGGLELRMALSQRAEPEIRERLGTAVEAQIMQRIGRLPLTAPSLWRSVGRARFLRGDAAGAEAAFRTSFAAWPHEDAEFYLGISLAAQGRRNEALSHLGRVCRTNPTLVRMIADQGLRRAVEDMLEVYRASS